MRTQDSIEEEEMDDKYKVVIFNLEYTGGRARYDKKVIVAQLCMRHHILIYHYFLATRPCEVFRQKLVDIQNHYKVWVDEKKKQKDSLLDLAAAIINPYYRDMKIERDKDKSI
ncbi:hypothetical protein D1007_05210 [Hordeum vulgare]|nr:hypothetical protein D1007_05210 [Hordeum vulgare]